MKVKDMIFQLQQQDPEAEVARADGKHEYWGEMYSIVRRVEFENCPVNGYKQNSVPCVVIY